jgi:hypothetical protein
MHSGVNDITVKCTVELMTLLWLAQRCQWYCCDMHSGVNDTAVEIWHVLTMDFIFGRLWLPLHRRISYTFYTVIFYSVQNLYGHFLYGHFLYGHFLYVQFLYSSKFIRFKIYTVQNSYGHFLYGSKFIQFKIYMEQNLYCRKRHN